MKTNLLAILIFTFLLSSCKKEGHQLKQIKSQTTAVDSTITANKSIDSMIQPFRNHINKTLDSTLAYAPETYSKKDYGSKNNLNTAIGNFMADVVYQQGNPIFKVRTGKNIDAVLLNHGGIRSVISKGNISRRTAYQVMPFENSIVVAALKKAQVDSLINYLSQQKKAHTVSNMQLVLNKDFSVNAVKINNEALKDKIYYIATSDYLVNGGDSMNFFKTNDSIYNLDYKIRNSLIDYFIKTDTISPKIDNRFIIKN